ncbi:Restriction modification system DNA specificity domain protein [Cupriavidus taiwanensis]|uniref:Restriction modification system DNA specificity domain protein n=1 Tax=Cupriavidus taiwanensis TaxID=164546 RepID=A0A375IF43_9BURK|nr:restriction endonuclease subunit S [Cupriavidus taiwanensis]SPK72680.1 Restriction modification system DNA specificity domain protein [Cupriavidus taiwanensis]
MSLPHYAEYSPSEIVGLGSLPSHWGVRRRADLSALIQTGPFGSQLYSSDYVDDATPVINPSNIDAGRILPDWQCTVPDEIVERLANHKLQAGDIVFARRGEMGRCALARKENEGWLCGTGSLIVRLDSMNPAFAATYLSTSFMQQWLQLEAVGSTMQNLNASILGRIPVPIPTQHEQAAIVTFLDREATKIDTLIAEQEKLLTLLDEKRQATISHAVTRGLRQDIPMKDWPRLGTIPAHWEVKRLKRVSPQITVGIVVEPSKYYVEDGIPALRSLNVKSGKIILDQLVYIDEAANQALSKSKLRVGDLVAVRTGQPGVTAVVPKELNGCNCIDLIVIRKPTEGSEFYLCWYLGSDVAVRQFAEGSGGAIQQHFNIGTAVNLVVPVPPEKEQIEIASFLDEETKRLDRLKLAAEHSVELLTERRAALITAAVTGKIDVRNAVPDALAA